MLATEEVGQTINHLYKYNSISKFVLQKLTIRKASDTIHAGSLPVKLPALIISVKNVVHPKAVFLCNMV